MSCSTSGSCSASAGASPGWRLATLIAEWSGLALGLWLCRAGLRRGAVARLGRVFDRGAAAAHGAGERRHPDPLGGPAGELHQLPVLRRRARRRDAGGEPGAAAVPRRSPPTRSTASPSPPRRWSARRSASARAPTCAGRRSSPRSGASGFARGAGARLPARRAGADRPDDDRAGGAGGGAATTCPGWWRRR